MNYQINSPIFSTFEINMKNLKSYLIVLILSIFSLILDLGFNKLLGIFGFILDPKNIDIEEYEKIENDDFEKIIPTFAKRNYEQFEEKFIIDNDNGIK